MRAQCLYGNELLPCSVVWLIDRFRLVFTGFFDAGEAADNPGQPALDACERGEGTHHHPLSGLQARPQVCHSSTGGRNLQ